MDDYRRIGKERGGVEGYGCPRGLKSAAPIRARVAVVVDLGPVRAWPRERGATRRIRPPPFRLECRMVFHMCRGRKDGAPAVVTKTEPVRAWPRERGATRRIRPPPFRLECRMVFHMCGGRKDGAPALGHASVVHATRTARAIQ